MKKGEKEGGYQNRRKEREKGGSEGRKKMRNRETKG